MGREDADFSSAAGGAGVTSWLVAGVEASLAEVKVAEVEADVVDLLPLTATLKGSIASTGGGETAELRFWVEVDLVIRRERLLSGVSVLDARECAAEVRVLRGAILPRVRGEQDG